MDMHGERYKVGLGMTRKQPPRLEFVTIDRAHLGGRS